MRHTRDIPFFPFIPVVPLIFIGGIVTLQLVTLASVRRLAQRLNMLAAT